MKIKSVLFLIILFISCQSDLVKKPKNLIDKNKMELIMQDMMLMRSISRNYQSFIKEKNWFGDKYIYDLKSFLDMNISLEYRYTKKVSAFIQFNNFTGKKYQYWTNFPVQSINILGGVTFSF